MSLAAAAQITDQDIRSTATSQGGEALGSLAFTTDGRAYAYGFNNTGSSTALSPGKLCSGAVVTANHVNQTGVTTVAGQQSLSFTVGATAVTANQYAGGYLVVNAGTGAGQALLIAGNTKAASGGTPTINLADAVITATAASDSKFSLVPNLYSAALLFASGSSTALVAVGVPNVSIPDQSYGWLQVGGASSVLANGTPAIGSSVIPSATTSGAVDVDLAASVQPKVGVMMQTAVSTEYRPVFLTVNHS